MVSVSSDKTLVCRQPDGRGLTVGTIPHPVIGLIGDPVMADSFPMAGKHFFMHCTGYFTIYLLSSNILVIKILYVLGLKKMIN